MVLGYYLFTNFFFFTKDRIYYQTSSQILLEATSKSGKVFLAVT